MCKIAVIPKITPATQAFAMKYAEALAPLLTKHDDDGFGYMALGEHGLFGERWLDVKNAFKKGGQAPHVATLAATYGAALVDDIGGYNSFGKAGAMSSLVLHARKATCNVSLRNVHPFVCESEEYAIVHNGVIGNSAKLGVKSHECDSEAILRQAKLAHVADDATRWQAVADALRGWYAVAAFVKDSAGHWWLDIVKDESTPLNAVYITELQGLAFSTSMEALHIAAKKLGATIEAKFTVAGDTIIRHDSSGNVVSTSEFESYRSEPMDWFTKSPKQVLTGRDGKTRYYLDDMRDAIENGHDVYDVISASELRKG